MSNDEWAFVVFYLTLMGEVAPQRRYPLREVLNSLWRMTPNDLPLWHAVYAQTRR